MNIRIRSVGTLKEKYWKEAAAEYKKRLSRYCSLSEEEVREGTPETEGCRLLKQTGEGEFVIALDIGGKPLSSEELAALLAELALCGKSAVTFVIGGSDGLSEEVLKRADFRLSFSAMTFPHQMMRVVLLEQIYRSFKINRGETYHK